MPLPVGSITPVVALAAMAASTALPPRSRICTPAAAASGWLDATTPYREATTERPGTGSRAADAFAAARTRRRAIGIRSLLSFERSFLSPRLTVGDHAPIVGALQRSGSTHGGTSEGEAASL